MEKTKKVLRIIICMLGFNFYSCKNIPATNTDYEMIDYAESCIIKFNEQNLHQIMARSNYYYCTYKDKTTSYVVSNNYKYIRQISNDTMKTIMKKDIIELSNSDSLIALLHIVESLNQHKISEIEVNTSRIKISTFNGYYLTNNVPQHKNSLRQVKDGWFSNIETNRKNNPRCQLKSRPFKIRELHQD